uniref:Uncharacterized protein n=1 Tax=Solanum lycopersicum TaxID=4081 RepID=A0A3Q7HRX2_SOLLC
MLNESSNDSFSLMSPPQAILGLRDIRGMSCVIRAIDRYNLDGKHGYMR